MHRRRRGGGSWRSTSTSSRGGGRCRRPGRRGGSRRPPGRARGVNRQSTTASWRSSVVMRLGRPRRRAVAGHRVDGELAVDRWPPDPPRPFGDHTGPRFSRMPTDLCGIGSHPQVGRVAGLAVGRLVGLHRDAQHLVGAFTEARRVGAQRRHHHRAAVGREARPARVEQAVVHLVLRSRLATRTMVQLPTRSRDRPCACRRATTPPSCRRGAPADRARSAGREPIGPRQPSRSDEYANDEPSGDHTG